LIIRAVQYARVCKAHVLLLVPQWKSSYLNPVLNELRRMLACIRVAVFDGRNMFKTGVDKTTYFTENYSGNGEVWELNFMML
jgi:hypothetical protein